MHGGGRRPTGIDGHVTYLQPFGATHRRARTNGKQHIFCCPFLISYLIRRFPLLHGRRWCFCHGVVGAMASCVGNPPRENSAMINDHSTRQCPGSACVCSPHRPDNNFGLACSQGFACEAAGQGARLLLPRVPCSAAHWDLCVQLPRPAPQATFSILAGQM